MKNQLTTWTLLPPDFKLQVTTDERGCLTTTKMGRTFDGSLYAQAEINWANKLAAELTNHFCLTYGFSHHDVIVLSSSEPDAGLLIWLKSKCPPPKVAIEHKKQPRLSDGYDVLDV